MKSLLCFVLAVLTFALTFGGASAQMAAEPVAVYRARLSQQDHYSSSNTRLTTVSEILRQDRANFHRFHRSDAEDEGDPLFANLANRARLDRLNFRGEDAATAREQILGGTPLVEITIYPEDIFVAVLEP